MPCFVKMFLCFIVRCVRACPQEGGASSRINRGGETTSNKNLYSVISIYNSLTAKPFASSYTIANNINTLERTKMDHAHMEVKHTNMYQIWLQEGVPSAGVS